MRGVTLTFTFNDSGEAVSFLSMLKKELGDARLYGEIKGKKLKVFIPEGERTDDIVRRVKTLYREIHEKTLTVRPRKLGVSTILSMANLEVAIPVPALVDVLNMVGKKAVLRGEYLETNASLKEAVEFAKKLSRAYKSLLHEPLTATARRLAAVASVVLGLEPDKAVDLLVSKGILKQVEGNVSLSEEYTKSLSRLRSLLEERRDDVRETSI